MKNTSSAGHEAAAEERMKLMRGINRRDEQIQESAALLLLMGNELARLAEAGNYNNEDGYGEFIATGLVLVSHSAARKLHESTLP